MGRRKKPAKVTVIEKNIKVNVIESSSSSLEEGLEKESNKEFSEFMTSGELSTPVLASGQSQAQDQAQQAEGTETGTPEQAREERQVQQPRGAIVNPEVSFYEAVTQRARQAVQTNIGTSRRAYTPQINEDDEMNRAVRVERAENIRRTAMLNDRNINFVNPQTEDFRKEHEDYYSTRMKVEEQKRKDRMPWELEE